MTLLKSMFSTASPGFSWNNLLPTNSTPTAGAVVTSNTQIESGTGITMATSTLTIPSGLWYFFWYALVNTSSTGGTTPQQVFVTYELWNTTNNVSIAPQQYCEAVSRVGYSTLFTTTHAPLGFCRATFSVATGVQVRVRSFTGGGLVGSYGTGNLLVVKGS